MDTNTGESRPTFLPLLKVWPSGYMPVAATVVKEKIFEAFYGEVNELKHFRHVNTYGGHPVATAVSLKNIEIVQRENLADNAAKMEAYIKGRLNEFADHPYVGEIRGKGLLLGIELFQTKKRRYLGDGSSQCDSSKLPQTGSFNNAQRKHSSRFRECTHHGSAFGASGK